MSKKTEKVKKPVLRKCAKCGKKFEPKTANAAYCSKECYKAAKNARRHPAKPVADKKPTGKKNAPKKVVKAVCKEPVKLPKKPTKIERIVEIHHGDNIRFVDYTPAQMMRIVYQMIDLIYDSIK